MPRERVNNDRRLKVFSVCLTPEEQRHGKAAAARQYRTLSQLMRGLLLEYMKSQSAKEQRHQTN